jgi:hypothetical protein
MRWMCRTVLLATSPQWQFSKLVIVSRLYSYDAMNNGLFFSHSSTVVCDTEDKLEQRRVQPRKAQAVSTGSLLTDWPVLFMATSAKRRWGNRDFTCEVRV